MDGFSRFWRLINYIKKKLDIYLGIYLDLDLHDMLVILPTYPGKIPQTSPNHNKGRNFFRTVFEGSGVSSKGMWVRS